MDPTRFDRLSRALAAHGPRRGVLGLLAALLLAGALGGLLGEERAGGQGSGAGVGGGGGRRRRRRRRARHHPGQDKNDRKRKRKKKKSRCTPEPLAQTCANRCGSVTNNCKKPVNCGSCACTPACDACFTCEEGPNTPGICVVDPAQQGESCGSDGKVCQADGSCTCVPLTECPAGKECGTISDGCGGVVTCPYVCANPTPICADNVCGPCTADIQCASGEICDRGQCVTGIGTCAEGANVCLTFDASCNGSPDCFCFPTRAGATRCARYYETPDGFLRPCNDDAACADLGAGAFCPQGFDSCGGVCSLPC